MKEYYKKLNKSEKEVELEINKIFKESFFVEDEKDGERFGANKLRRLIKSWKKWLNKADIDKYNQLFKNFDVENFAEIRAYFSENHANIIKEMKSEHKDLFTEFSQFLRETIGAKTRLRILLFGIEEDRKIKEFPFAKPPNYPQEYDIPMSLLQVDLNQLEIEEWLAKYYTEGLKTIDENHNFDPMIFYGSSLLAQIHYINETKGENSDIKWVETRKTILGIVDSLREIDSKNTIIFGNLKLNELYQIIKFPDYFTREKEIAKVIF
uniref:DUF4135 domain-containing protein n=1 Tax=Meloidogyne hapla TaxID=6305 RepID=A0A1I8BSA2_MELHA